MRCVWISESKNWPGVLIYGLNDCELNTFSMNSSLTYEILLYLNSYYFWMFALCELGLGAFKLFNLPYPIGTFITECIIFSLLCFMEATRIFMGHKGNLTERSFPVMISLLLTIPCSIGVLYYLLWQTYVLRLEVVLCGIQLTFLSLEIIFATVCIVSFYRSRIY